MDGTVEGTANNDIIDATYTGDPEGETTGAGDDIVIAGEGNDQVFGGAGNDDLSGALDDDYLFGGDGDDLMSGNDGQDLLRGEAGNDILFGNDGDDTLKGGDGDDYLNGGDGADVLGGEAGRDKIVVTAGDEADGGSEGDDNDVLDLRGVGPYRIDDRTPDSNGNGFDGTVTLLDADGVPTGETITFVEIEAILDDSNDAPVAMDDMATTDEDTPVDISVLDNDTDADGDPLSVTSATAENGTVTIGADGTLTYTPDADYNGADEITYTIIDGNGGSDTGTVAVTVTPVNDAPVANDDMASTTASAAVVIPVLLNDTDVDGDPLTVTSATATSGTVAVGADGTLTYTPDDGFTGSDTITYTIDDGNGGTDAGEVAVTVGEGDMGPMLDGTVQGTPGDDLIDLAYTGDPDGDMVDANDAIVPGTVGNDDIIYGLSGNDTILAGDGDDLVHGGNDDDEIYGGTGSDTIYGDAGDDYIDSSDGGTNPGRFDNPYPPLPMDPDPFNDRDTVLGGAGNDTILTGDDQDSINGGDGDDYIDAGIDDDSITGGSGNDTIIGGEGNDVITGRDGDDVIYGGLGPFTPDALNIADDNGDLVPDNGLDLIFGGDGNDTIYGRDDDDTLFGGTGDDVIFGGVDDDVIFGGAGDDVLSGDQGDDVVDGGTGNDVITGGVGNDVLSGDDDRDVFIGGNGGDVVDGGSGGDDFDTLDLTEIDFTSITYTSDDREDGFVTFLDGSRLVFSEIENIIGTPICFTPGTTIATPRGERLVEDLREGDRIITRDNGIQEIRWAGSKDLTARQFAAAPHLKPVLIKAGALGNGLPERDMMVSPNHRLLVASDRTQLYFDESEVLVAAKHLVGTPGVHEIDVTATTYIHFLFDRHEVVLSNGAWTESFQPGDYSLKGIGNSQRNEIMELFPELKTPEGLDAYQAARKSLKKHEARLLVK